MSGTARDPALPARTVPLDPGEIIGETPDSCWRVVRHVADGGFSSVYEVRPASPETLDRHGGAPRALKCVWGTPAELTTMNDEASKTQLVDGHPNVLTLVTSFRFERSTAPHHHVGLVLELADEDLPTFAARVRLDERAWAAVFEQVAAGLEHIHARRVVHGDIKPTNVLRIGARFAVADFGVSAPLESTRSAGIGLARTLAFWPPESATQGVLQADGVRRPPVEGWRASQLGDVWALAVSAHRMLTGRHITAGTTPEQQYELVCLGRYAVDRRLGPGWQRLLEDCLVQDPRRRRVTTPAQFRQRAAELAVPPAYAGVPWPAGSPRLAALVDLDPAAGGPLLALSVDRPGGRVSGELVPADGVLPAALLHLTEDVLPTLAARPTPFTATAHNSTAALGSQGAAALGPNGAAGLGPNGAAGLGSNGAAGPGSNGAAGPGPNAAAGPGAHGAASLFPNGAPASNGAPALSPSGASAPLPNGAAAPNGRAAPSGPAAWTATAAQNGASAPFPNGAGAAGAAGAVRTGAADPAATQIVTLAELERTRQQTAAISAQRDRLAAQRDEVAADRDRLRREHAELARRLDRLEREAGLRRPPVAERERTAILAPARREPTLTMAPVSREPTKTYEPRPAAPPQPRPSTSDRPPAPSTSDPKPSAVAVAGGRLARRLGRMLRRLIVLVVVLGILSVLALVGISALFNTTPDKVMNRVVVILDQVHGAGS
jgi:serine/threonine-protein kinase